MIYHRSSAILASYREAASRGSDSRKPTMNGRRATLGPQSLLRSFVSRRDRYSTPEGDANLYIAQETPVGFSVRETHGGLSTISFSYRIVAKPFGSHEARLPMVELPRLRVHGMSHARSHS